MTNDRQARAARAEKMRKEGEKTERRQRNVISVAIVAVVVVLVGVGGWAIKNASDENATQTEVVTPKNVTENGFDYPAAKPAAEGAPLVETYEDFLCSHCGDFEATTGPYLRQKADAGEISLRFNPMTIMDGEAEEGTAHDVMNTAVCAADEQGLEAFWKVHDALFAARFYEGSTRPTNPDLLKITEGLGIDGLDSCVKTGKFVPWINEAREVAQKRGVTGTPTIFVADKKIEGFSQADLDKAIAEASK